MNNVNIIAIDIAKRIFHFCAGNSEGRVIYRKKKSRDEVINFMHSQPRCTVVMEACGGANYWAREFTKLGFETKLISPQFVKPFCKSNKNDTADAEAIMEAALRPTMRFVGVKTTEQQDIQCLHRVRQRLVKQRTATANEIRGLLIEYGLCVPQGISHIRNGMAERIERSKDQLSTAVLRVVSELMEDFKIVDKRVSDLDKQLKKIAESHPVCKKLMEREGVGPAISTAIVSYVGNPHIFKCGRELSAYFGLVPKQNSTGGKQRLGRISKRGDKYIRQLLIHGARSVLLASKKRTDPQSMWIKSIRERRGFNKACVAMANKTTRILWVLLAKDDVQYKPSAKAA